MKIYKYELRSTHEEFTITGFSRVLKCEHNGTHIMFWCEINDDYATATVINLAAFTTGQQFNELGWVYLDTLFFKDLVFHMYWCIKETKNVGQKFKRV